VLLTYFSITTSYIPIYFNELAHNPQKPEQLKQKAAESRPPQAAPSSQQRPSGAGGVGALASLVLIFAAAPFFGLASGVSGLISLFIIFIGLQRAWRLTARSQILVMGPYEFSPTP
jgi:hypothetical protein